MGRQFELIVFWYPTQMFHTGHSNQSKTPRYGMTFIQELSAMKVGVKWKMSGLDYSLAYSKMFREMIIRHAHRYVYADRPQKGMLALNARVVNRDIYEYEQQSIAGWHIENVEAERRLLDC